MASLPYLGSEPAEFYGLEKSSLKPKTNYRQSCIPDLRPPDHHQVSPTKPTLLDTLLRNLKFDLEAVTQVIDPILTARNYCHIFDHYLQGIIVNDKCFIASNINRHQEIQVTPCGSRWLIGRGTGCKIIAMDFGVSFYHASLSFSAEAGFFLTDLDSSSGTLVNHQRLAPAHPHPLQDGDLVKMGSLCFEFLEELCLSTEAV
ncbi:MAG: FHA domain-containing protein [Nodosilinea sp.]